MDSVKKLFVEHVKDLQDRITNEIKRLDPEVELVEDIWKREDFAGNDGGGGRTRAFMGNHVENAGVNFSEVYGVVDPKFADKIGGNGNEMWAAGISLIIHPRNPRVPTTHANFRMIQAGDKFWFGGGGDLTPYYPHTEDFDHFHGVWKKVCDQYGTYEEMKKKCDRYFTNTHRDNEMRGIGGVFFDHWNTGDVDHDMKMVREMSEQFIPSYFPIFEKRRDESFTEEDEDFMLHRRGRYVEFNLLHDRGTKFGLESKGRIDSILISLPARVKYTYKFAPRPGTPQAEMMKFYQLPEDSK